jgi:hypothetical protein
MATPRVTLTVPPVPKATLEPRGEVSELFKQTAAQADLEALRKHAKRAAAKSVPSFARFLLERMELAYLPSSRQGRSVSALQDCLRSLRRARRALPSARGWEPADQYPVRVTIGQAISQVKQLLAWEKAIRATPARSTHRPSEVTFLIAVLAEHFRETSGRPRWGYVLKLVQPYTKTDDSEAVRVRASGVPKPARTAMLAVLKERYRELHPA